MLVSEALSDEGRAAGADSWAACSLDWLQAQMPAPSRCRAQMHYDWDMWSLQILGSSVIKMMQFGRVWAGFGSPGTCRSKLVSASEFSAVAGNSHDLCSPFSNCKVREVLLAFLTGLEGKFINICETSDALMMSATEKPMRKLRIRFSEQVMDVMQ